MNVKFGSTDDLSDMGLHKYFIQHENLVKLVTIRNPYISIDFRSEKSEDIKKDVENFKNFKTSEYYKNLNGDLDIIEFEVNCHTRLSTFLNLYMILPSRFFTVIEDFRIPFSFKEIYIPADYPEKIASTLSKRYDEIQPVIDTLQTSAYDKISHTYMNSMISYTIKLSLEEINLYINQLLKNRKFSKETTMVLNTILSLSKTVYKTTH